MPIASPPLRAAHSPDSGVQHADPAWRATAVVVDGFAHGVLAATPPDLPLILRANPAHPSALAGTDLHAQAALQQLGDPDRSSSVRRRVARGHERGAAVLEASDWQAFEQAWRERAGTRDGASLRILTGPVTSPTERGLIEALLARRPNARWHVSAPLKDVAADDGAHVAFGRAVTPVFHLDRARCVLALAADPFSDGPGALRQSRDATTAQPVLFAAEATPGRFGARAAHRIALAPARIEALLWRLASHWMPEIPASDTAGPDAETAVFEQRLLAALHLAGDAALVIGGAGLSPEAHALIFALNQRLGAIGRTVTLINPPDSAQGAGTLADLVHALRDGNVDTLLMMGVNPAYDAPSSFGMTLALSRARLLVHAGLYVDETAVLSDWHLPLSHPLEQWGDARAHDGAATLLQPVVAPRHDTRSAAELLALIADDELRDGRGLVRRQWQSTPAPAGFEALWNDSLRSGVVARSASRPLDVAAARLPARRVQQPVPTPPALTALFVPDPMVHDGSYANLGALQALPRPFTGIVRGNALLLAPATAARLGVVTGDVVRAHVDVQSVEAPVWVMPGHADDVVTLPLGGGRRQAGRVGNGVGFDACALRPTTASVAPIALSPTGKRHAFMVSAPISGAHLDPAREPAAPAA